MIGSWVVYALLVSSLVGVAAWVAESGARAQHWPGRWIWAAALVASVGTPVSAWLLPSTPEAAPLAAVPGAYVMSALPSLTLVAEPAGASPATLALSAWAAVSALLLVALVGVGVRLDRRRRRWPSRTVDGVEVLVSRRTGPAAVGVLRGRVVLPEWTLSLAGPRRRLLVMHEAEHVRARDPQLALFGLLVCALMPWNLPLWWQLRRLRLSIEVDCDARVLRRTGDRRGYGSLLLEVGQRRTRLALGLAEPRTMLERRIRMIATTTRKATLRAAGLAVAAGLVLAVACETPEPTAQTAEELDAEPALTAMTVRPRLRNQEQVGEALRDHYPPALRDAGIEGTANVRLFIDEDGHVRNARINRTSGHEALDEAATRVARLMEFTPASDQDRPVPVWVAMDVRFALHDGPADGGEGAAAGAPDAAAADNRADAPGSEASERAGPGTEPYPESPREVSEAPTFTPMTEAPRLQNATETSERLQAHYPTELRDAGIGGTANVWFFIDAEGAVKKAVVNRGSGYPALDEAALEVARLMEFTPARNRDEPVPVWVALDIRFRAE